MSRGKLADFSHTETVGSGAPVVRVGLEDGPGQHNFTRGYNISVELNKVAGSILILAGAMLTVSSAYAQSVTVAPSKISNPSDLAFTLDTIDGRHRFNFGETIPIALTYSSTTPGRYFFVQRPERLEAGKPEEITCQPSENVRDLWHLVEPHSISRFLQAGHACELGVGGGYGGSCGDCDGETSIANVPVRFQWDLNMELKFLQPGAYECIATAATVTEDPPSVKLRHAQPLVSKPLQIELVENPRSAQATLSAVTEQIERLHCTRGVEPNEFQCMQLLGELQYLGTEDALREAARLYNGWPAQRGGQQLWHAILESQHQHIAFRLMEAKLKQPDFSVTELFLDWLATASLRDQTPAAFEPQVNPAIYQEQSIEVLRRYVRDLGRVLPNKRGVAFIHSRNTYANYSQMQFCHPEPLILPEEMDEVLAIADSLITSGTHP